MPSVELQSPKIEFVIISFRNTRIEFSFLLALFYKSEVMLAAMTITLDTADISH